LNCIGGRFLFFCNWSDKVYEAYPDIDRPAAAMTDKREQQWQQLILRRLFEHPGREAILIPSMFTPPILLTNILRLGTELSKKGYTTPPDRRMGGWHMKLLEPGVTACQGPAGQGLSMR
jgi:hypothetical protein